MEENSVEFGFDHVHFLVSDVRVLTEYFERVFGMETLEFLDDHKGAAYSIFQLGGGTLKIRGMRDEDAPDARHPNLVEGLDHVGFAVDDVEASVAWLESRGAEVLMPPRNTGIGGRSIAFIKGPGNVRIELCERVSYSGPKI
jgi:catechol 2,3-dioxygenase-like lactoylglutathione lyase family enzyme